MHRSLVEILDALYFFCPGCQERFSYKELNTHVKLCVSIRNEHKLGTDELIKILKSKFKSDNVVSLDQANISGTSIGNEVFVLDNDFIRLYVYNLLTRNTQTFAIQYESTDYIYSKSRKGDHDVLPHNFQIV